MSFFKPPLSPLEQGGISFFDILNFKHRFHPPFSKGARGFEYLALWIPVSTGMTIKHTFGKAPLF
jgi:hypothetical protein